MGGGRGVYHAGDRTQGGTIGVQVLLAVGRRLEPNNVVPALPELHIFDQFDLLRNDQDRYDQDGR
jgi:hypothetical protein